MTPAIPSASGAGPSRSGPLDPLEASSPPALRVETPAVLPRVFHPRPLRPTVLTTFSSALAVLVVGLFLQTFVMQTYRIPSGSMEPALQIGDCVLVSKTSAGPAPGRSLLGDFERRILPSKQLHRGDMVVFHFPPDPRRELVKRVVGIPGDRLRLHEGKLFLGGEPVPERYAFYAPAQPEVFRDEFPNLREADPGVDPRWWRTLRHLGADGELQVPPGDFFVLGDNRNNSEDSRYWGFVPQSSVIGRPLLVYFAVPDGQTAPEGGLGDRLGWLLGWLHQRVGRLR